MGKYQTGIPRRVLGTSLSCLLIFLTLHILTTCFSLAFPKKFLLLSDIGFYKVQVSLNFSFVVVLRLLHSAVNISSCILSCGLEL